MSLDGIRMSSLGEKLRDQKPRKAKKPKTVKKPVADRVKKVAEKVVKKITKTSK